MVKIDKIWKKVCKMNFSKKYAQNIDFSRFLKKWKKWLFFHFPKTQNRCLTQSASLVEKISGFFFLYSISLFNIIVLNICQFWKKRNRKFNISKKLGQNLDFSIFLKKWKNVTFFQFPKTPNRCPTQNVNFAEKICAYFCFFSLFLTSLCWK